VVVMAGLALVAANTPVHAYIKIGTQVDNRMVNLRWTTRPVRWFVHDRGVPGVSPDQFRQAADRAFESWQDLPTSSITFEYGGMTSAGPLDEDGRNTLGFLSRPDLDRVLASTSFLIDTRTGEILESDVFFNSDFAWSVAPGGQAEYFDLESIILHEAGHLLGLGHSALGETELRPGGGRRVIAAGAVMFPIAFAPGNIEGRRLTADDIAGASDVYPDGRFRQQTGSIQGRVTRGGRGVFGAHVVAYDPSTGALVGGFSLDEDGGFVIAGLQPGIHVVRVEPLDDGDLDSFFDETEEVDLDFAPMFYERLVVVPRGGASDGIELTVGRR
jgi:hypothetical protein